MILLNRHKITIFLLVSYWIALIIFAHIQVPDSVRSANISDKALHVLAYLVLTFFLWFSIKPHEKVKWHKIHVWLVFLIITGYGAIDEVIQSFVGRTCDVLDIAANISGILLSLFILTFLSFRTAVLLVSAIVIFGITNVTKTNLTDIFPLANTTFQLFTYTIFTFFWLLNLNIFFSKKPSPVQWLTQAIGFPACFLIIILIFSILAGKDMKLFDMLVPAFTIIAVISIGFLKMIINNSKDITGNIN